MILSLFHRLHARYQRRQSMGYLLLRADDHLLRDIGLTRADLEVLLREEGDAPAPVVPACGEPCAGRGG